MMKCQNGNSDADATIRRRLTKKSSTAPGHRAVAYAAAVKCHRRVPREAARAKLINIEGLTALRAAVRMGAIPKARKPFALFMAEQLKDSRSLRLSRDGMCARLRHVAALWKDLRPGDKDLWRQRSQTEFEVQRSAATRNLTTAPHCKKVSIAEASPSQLDMDGMRLGADFLVLPHQRSSSGSYGTVVRVQHQRTDRVFAAKIFRDKSDLQIELNAYTAVKESALFLQPVAAYSAGPISWLVTPWVSGGSAACRVKTHGAMTPTELFPFALQVGAALQYMHGLNLLHLDVKPANVLWHEATRTAYLTDFNTVTKFPVQPMNPEHDIVTSFFRPPEVFIWRPGRLHCVLHPAVDLWSFGVSIHYLATGKHLFAGKDEREVINKIHGYSRHPQLCLTALALEPFRSVVLKLTCLDPGKRLPLAGVESGRTWMLNAASAVK